MEPSTSRTWIPVRLWHDDSMDLSYCVTSELPPRLWRCRAVVDARPGDVLAALVRERHSWDETLSRWRVVQRLDDNTDLFHYVIASSSSSSSSASAAAAASDVALPRPAVDMCELRYRPTCIASRTVQFYRRESFQAHALQKKNEKSDAVIKLAFHLIRFVIDLPYVIFYNELYNNKSTAFLSSKCTRIESPQQTLSTIM